MGILENLRALQARMASPAAPGEAVKAVLVAGKREHLLAGVDAQGRPFDGLRRSTLRRGRSDPRPLLPKGADSNLITRYRVEVEPSPDGCWLAASWPGLDHVRYLRTGTRRMARRDPTGFRAEDVAKAREIFRRWIVDGKR
jgi:hypothetical protein